MALMGCKSPKLAYLKFTDSFQNPVNPLSWPSMELAQVSRQTFVCV